MELRRRVLERTSEFLLFAVTPPRLSTSPERAQQIADATLDRLRPLALDGLVLYDIDDESDRNAEKRPFPFQATMDPADYLTRHLGRVSQVCEQGRSTMPGWVVGRCCQMRCGVGSNRCCPRSTARDARFVIIDR